MGRMIRRQNGDAARLTTGQRLTMLMADRGVTTGRLAASLRIQESTLTNFREGFRSIPSEVVAGMAVQLDTNVAFLLESSEDDRPAAVILEESRLREAASRTRPRG